ncbi:P1 family peptidase [Promineifilum sp.]|uniref:P1 family peptidase n=1 Tax=Promineifilum sp. TaxID=2664178 RepID=UPI0035AEDC1E
MPRIRELGICRSALPPGPRNAISDVAGVTVGHYTLIAGEGVADPGWRPGHGPFRTGVTIIRPHGGNLYEEKVAAAVHTINGFGKPAGFEQVRELGLIETPVALTGTMNVPRVADALMTLAVEQSPYIGVGFPDTGWRGYTSVNPVVGETSDGYLSDLQARPIGLTEVRAALAAASAEVAEGAVGAGTGTSCYGWKGGIGTASRVLPERAGGFTVGALVQSNFGRAEELVIGGVPVGRYVRPPDEAQGSGGAGEQGSQNVRAISPGPQLPRPPAEPGGSIMMILATDAPLDARGLGRLCRRAAFGLARTGSTCHGGSGDFVIAFSTTNRVIETGFLGRNPVSTTLYEQPLMEWFAAAVVESIEEAIYNSLLMAETVVGRNGHVRYGLPAEEVAKLIAQRR